MHFFGNLDGVGAHALQMGVSRMILGLDGEGQRLDRAHVERRDLFHVPLFDLNALFLGLQSPEIESVGAINPVNQRENEQ